jgi:hypothetical protein
MRSDVKKAPGVSVNLRTLSCGQSVDPRAFDFTCLVQVILELHACP